MDYRHFFKQPHRIVFFSILFIYGTVIFTTFLDYGITPDETGHMHYGRSVVHWYTTFFAERSIFTWTNTWLYGGIYDAISYLATKISPLDVYDTRHFLNAIVGLLGVVVAYHLGKLLGNPWIGCLAALFLILTPRYYGHVFNNHKDIPFAVAYLWSIYCLIRNLSYFPNISRMWLILTGISLGITMGIRVGGMLLFFYLAIFYGYLCIKQLRTAQHPKSHILKSIKQLGAISATAYVVMLSGWPWAQLNPLIRPFQALTVFSKFPIPFINFFDGTYIKSTELPWYYAPKWLLITLPEFALLGLLAGIVLILYTKPFAFQIRTLQIGLLIFSTLFPLTYVALTHAALYDAMRHVLFTLPPLIVTSALGIGVCIQTRSQNMRYTLGGLTGVLMIWTSYQMISLHPNQYVYFNHLIAGGVTKATTQYDTDYLDNGYKKGLQWVQQNTSSPHPIRLYMGTSTPYPIDPTRFVYEENPFNADIYLITTHLNQHQAIPGEVLHQIKANGVPVLYIIRPDNTYHQEPLFTHITNPYHGLILGDLYERTHQPQKALLAYQTVLQYDPEFARAYAVIGNILANLGNTQQAIDAYQKAIVLNANDAAIFTNLGDCYTQQNQHAQAIEAYQKAIAIRPYYLKAIRNLAKSLSAAQQHKQAIQTMQKALFINPNSISDLQLLGSIFVYAGLNQKAHTNFMHLKELAPNDPSSYLNLNTLYQRQQKYDLAIGILKEGLALLPDHTPLYTALAQTHNQQGQKKEAAQVYVTALKRQPQNVILLRDLGTLLAEMGQLEQAIQLLSQALTLDPSLSGVWYMLGQIYQHQNKTEQATQAYRHVLEITPNHTNAQQRLNHLLGL